MSQFTGGKMRGDILLVDDMPDNLRVLSAMLTNQGFEVRKALNGRRALISVQADLPNLILLDIKMPEMDGYTVCEKLKADPKTRSVPVIFISALDDALDKVRAFAAGGVDYVTKPFQEMEVLARIEHQLCIQRLQKQLVEHNQELERSNRELEHFAYVVSHDLQQPLQSITGFAKVLQLKLQNSLDESAQDYLSRIYDTGNRMQSLIQDLLAYSMVGKQGKSPAMVDLNLVFQQVLDNLKVQIAERSAVIEIPTEPLPTILGYDTQIVQLFQNLISNALKFVDPAIAPHIVISLHVDDDQCQFNIRDNGIGIAAQDQDRIFEIFQRGHDTANYNGTGIGLATCKKIVENHDGKIKVSSEVGVGTTISLTLRRGA